MIMGTEYTRWVQDNLSLIYKPSHIKKGQEKTMPVFHARFVKALHKSISNSDQEHFGGLCMPLLLIHSFAPSYGVRTQQV